MDLVFENVARWLPESLDPQTVENWIGNYELYPQVLPVTATELYLTQAVARERLAFLAAEQKNKKDQKIDWEGITESLRKIHRTEKELVLTLLDGLQPEGVVDIPGLATVICPGGQVTLGRVAAEAEVDLGLVDKQKILVPPDEVLMLPIPKGEKAKLKIKLFGNLRLDKKSGLMVEVVGGTAGVVIDTRGRPLLPLAADNSGRARIQKWREAIV